MVTYPWLVLMAPVELCSIRITDGILASVQPHTVLAVQWAFWDSVVLRPMILDDGYFTYLVMLLLTGPNAEAGPKSMSL